MSDYAKGLRRGFVLGACTGIVIGAFVHHLYTRFLAFPRSDEDAVAAAPVAPLQDRVDSA